MNHDFELIGGEEQREIKIVPYDKNWPLRYKTEKKKIEKAIASQEHHIEHVGSTSIEGLPAKPIIDIQVSIQDPNDESSFVPALEEQGYILRVREEGHRMMRTSKLDVHIHICQIGSDWERRHLLFRDWLRHNETDRKAYGDLKEKLSKQSWETMNHYADAKGDLIQEITKRAEAWAAASDWRV